MRLLNNTMLKDEIRIKRKTETILVENKVVLFDEYRVSQNIVLRYMSVCTPDFLFFNANKNAAIYSALIILNENGVDIETKFIYDISRSENEAYQIMKQLSENGVTPDTAYEIISELI